LKKQTPSNENSGIEVLQLQQKVKDLTETTLSMKQEMEYLKDEKVNYLALNTTNSN